MKGFKIYKNKEAILLEDILFKAILSSRENGYSSIILPSIIDISTNSWAFKVYANQGHFYGFLRPEGTRQYLSFLKEGKYFKHYYWGSMFRNERSQLGRRREFLQFCLELTKKFITSEDIVQSLKTLLKILSNFISIKELKLTMNYLGTKSEKNDFLNTLQFDNEKSLHLLDRNKLIYKAKFSFESRLKNLLIVQKIKSRINISSKFNPELFRGLTYYNGFIFEIKYRGYTIAGGGNYDGAWGEFNKKKVNYHHFGWGLGISRLVELLKIKKIS